MLNATVVTAAGDVHQRLIATARSSHGPELQQLLYGSEGNLGMIVSALVKVTAAAARRSFLHRRALAPIRDPSV